MENRLGWALLSGTFGLLFGALCAPVDLVVGGPALAFSRWVSGIPFGEARVGRNPRTKEPMVIPATRVPTFKASKTLKDALEK